MNNLESLLDLASALAQQSDFQEVLRLVAQGAAGRTGAETALVMMVNPSTGQTVKTVFRENRSPDSGHTRLEYAYFSGWVIENRMAFVSGDPGTDVRFNREALKNLPPGSVMCLPLTAEGRIIGTLLLTRKASGTPFTGDDLADMTRFTAVTAPFLRNTQKIQQYFSAPLPDAALLKKFEAFGMVGKSRRFVELLAAVEAASKCDVRVLLEGASGTGKELIARAIHRCGSRMPNKFVAVDCGAIPANLIESELFGHVKGAFTGAASARRGLMEEASGGTLFMDEIANLPLEMQSKLLRVLQEGEIRPLGGNETRRVDVRIISASSTLLRRMVADGRFREDLFYRLYVYPIPVPALSERKDDIPVLANVFLKNHSAKHRRSIEAFHEDVLEYFRLREWPGNIRELENFVERMVATAPENARTLDAASLPVENREEWSRIRPAPRKQKHCRPLRDMLAEREREILRQALEECDWNRSEAARVLGISEHSMRYKIEKLGLDRFAKKP